MNISIAIILKIIGWLFISIPLGALFIFCIYMLIGLSKDDEAIKSLITVGFVIFFIGLSLLILTYLTNVFSRL